VPAKALAAALSIGAGASVGPEDPSVQIGSSSGSMIGQWLHMSDDRVRILVAAGAASGVAAAFNAPIAGVFFAIEIILGEVSGSAMGVVLLAAVVSAATTQGITGPEPAFVVPIYPYHSPLELPLYLGLGLLVGPIAALYVRMIYLAQDLFHAWHVPAWVKPAAAGLIVGTVGLFLPQVKGVGYPIIEQILNQSAIALPLLLALALAKAIVTPISVGGGFVGGVFAPALFIGATLGGAYGEIMRRFFPTLDLTPGSFAMAGMAALLAGAIHAPLTAILLLFEMTNDYRVILPLMFAVTVSLLLSQRLQRDSVYMLGLARKGIRIQRGRDVEVLEAITVGEVMDTDHAALHEAQSLTQATAVLQERRSHGLPVVDDFGKLSGILTVQDIERAQAEAQDPPPTVGQACTREVLVAYPDESMGVALQRMSTRDIGRLPVVDRDDAHRLVGVLRRSNVIRAYDTALTRRATLRHRAHQVRLGAIGGVDIQEFTIAAGSFCEGRQVSQISWPRDCVIATLRRGRRLHIPRGNTVLQVGDVLAVVAEGDALATVAALCASNGAGSGI
jgi:CIC family chloride channel protein